MNLVKISSINIWDEEWENGWYPLGVFTPNASVICSKNLIKVVPNAQYYLLKQAQIMYITPYDANGNFIRIAGADANGRIVVNNSITAFIPPSGVHYIQFNMSSSYGTTYHNDIQICLNSEAEKTIYHPHWVLGLNNGNAITCDISQMLPSEVLVVDLGDLNWVKYNATGNTRNYYYLPLGSLLPNCGATGGINGVSTNIICTKYTPITRSKVYYDTSVDGIDVEATGSVFIGDESFSGDATAFKNYVKGVKLFYKKATS